MCSDSSEQQTNNHAINYHNEKTEHTMSVSRIMLIFPETTISHLH